METAPAGQFFAQIPQPMQPALQTLVTAAPRSVLEQITAGPASAVLILITLLGQAEAQAPQPVHFSGSTCAAPFTT